MSKITQYARHLAVVAAATLLAQCAWAEVHVGDQLVESNLDTQFTNIDGAQTVLINKLLIPGTDDLPAGSKVTIQSIGIAYRNNHHPYLVLSQGGNASRASSEGVESTKTVTKSDGTTADIKWIEYSFSGVEVTVGTEEPCYQRAGQSGSSTSEAKDLALFKPKSGVGVLQSSFADYSLAYEINYTVTKIVGSIVFDKTAVAVSEINALIPTGETTVAVKVPADTTITVDAEPTASLNVKSEGAVTVVGSADHAITSTDVTKISLGSVAGAKKFVLPSIIDGMTAPAAGITYLYQGGDALTTLPYARNADNEDAVNIAGTVEIAKTVTIDGQLVPYGNKNYVISDGASITAGKLTLANKGGVTQTFVQNGGSVTVTSSDPATSTGAAMLLGHWSSTANYTVNGGTLSVANAPIRLGWDGTGNMTVAGGTVTTTGFRGGSQNGHGGAANLVLNSGVIEMGADGIDLGNSGAVTLNGGTLKATDNATITVGKSEGFKLTGSTTINVADGKTLTLASSLVSSNGGAIVKTGTGTIAVGTNRPTMNVVEGSVKITATSSEIAAGKLVLTVTPDAAAASDDKVTIVDGEGNAIEISGVSIEGTTVTITLVTIPPVTTSTSISELALLSDTTGTLVIEGGDTEETAITITFDANLPEAVDVAVMGFVKFVTTGGIEIPYAKMTFEEGCTIIFDAIDGYDIPAGATVIAGTATGTITNAGTLTIGTMTSGTITNAGTLNIKGDSTFKLTNTGTVNLVSGVSTISSDAQSIKGTINIAYGATYKSANNDQVPYGGSETTTINVRGTLDMGTTRWTVGGADTINLYGGCTVSGQGDSAGLFDLYREGNVINVLAGEGDQASETTVTIPAPIRARNANGNISIADGMKLALTGGIKNADVSGATINMNGNGRLTGTIPLKGGFILNLGTSVGTIDAKFVAESGDTALTLGQSSGGVQISTTDTEDEPFLKINSGATLQLYVKDFSSWNNAVTEHAWIKNEGTLNIREESNEHSRYFRGHLVMKPGTTTTLYGASQNFIVYGGNSDVAKAQMIVPSSETAATATFAGEGTIQLNVNGSGGTAGSAWDIGANSTLDVQTKVIGSEAIVKYGAGTLKLSNAENTYAGAVTIKAGTIKSATTLTVSAPEGYTLNSDTESEEGMTIYTVTRDAGMVYAKDKTFTQFVLEDSTVVDLVAGDTIVCDSHMEGNVWGGGVNPSNFAAYQIVLAREMDFGAGSGIPANGKVTVNYADGNKGIYLYGNIGAGATIDGTGLLYLGHTNNACTIGDGATISCNVAFQNDQKIATINGAVTISGTITMGNGLFKLASGATLTCAELPEGKVTTDVEGKVVKYADGKYTLVDAAEELPGEAYFSGEGAAEYKAWALATGVKADTAPENAEDLAIAYLLGVTGTTTIADALAAAKDEVEDLIAEIDCSKLAEEDGLTAALAALNETLATKGLKATLASVPAEEIETTAKLYRLVINAIPANTVE